MCPLISTSLAMSSALQASAWSLGFLMGYYSVCSLNLKLTKLVGCTDDNICWFWQYDVENWIVTAVELVMLCVKSLLHRSSIGLVLETTFWWSWCWKMVLHASFFSICLLLSTSCHLLIYAWIVSCQDSHVMVVLDADDQLDELVYNPDIAVGLLICFF